MGELQQLRGLGPKRRQALLEAGISDLYGLLDCLPQRYLDARQPQPVASLRPGQACVQGRIIKAPSLSYFGGRSIVRARLSDQSGSLALYWFNQPWMARQLAAGQQVSLHGLVQRRADSLQLTNPKVLSEQGIFPVYRPLPGLPGKVFASLISQALVLADAEAAETLPADFRKAHQLISRLQAWRYAHQPANMQQIAQAQRRLAFENLLLYQLAVRLAGPQGQPGPEMSIQLSAAQIFWAGLPFQPTQAQHRTLDTILSDMAQPCAMRRLVQGDVGSGKTAVAFGAALACIRAGYQCALMAPTELLARQHYLNAQKLLAPFQITCGLLTGGLPADQRRQALAGIAEGSWQLVIGTHALIGKSLQYHNLGLVIVDEQHRFGVRQRQSLADKAQAYSPHLLALSATPIPRSLALVLYGDLQVSVIDQLPPGRSPVKTRIVPAQRREELYAYLRKKALQGEQSYLVCPLVEEGEEDEERKSATALFKELKAGDLKGIGLGLTYGSQGQAEKEKTLEEFYAGRTQVLVSTTVIEVGMDVPQATTMVIEDAENFGLAQLHQLRGRVGRGDKESWCFLVGEANERLTALADTNDGFVIAQKDLEQRGPGEFLGTRQHGRLMSVYGMHDVRLIDETAACLRCMAEDPASQPLLNHLKTQARQRFAQRLEAAGFH